MGLGIDGRLDGDRDDTATDADGDVSNRACGHGPQTTHNHTDRDANSHTRELHRRDRGGSTRRKVETSSLGVEHFDAEVTSCGTSSIVALNEAAISRAHCSYCFVRSASAENSS